ncbi:hypothetical protein CRUP_014901 [Coryphaenoides rupestris]|nr:hypothetical protein CRUP_014901 [Coryphaenoides rupestris]
MKPLFNSCDSFKDGKLSNNEWCYCFQKPDGMPCQTEKTNSLLQGRRKGLIGAFVPRCTEEGYFKPTQCHGSRGQCWRASRGDFLGAHAPARAVVWQRLQRTEGGGAASPNLAVVDAKAADALHKQ